MIQLKTLNDQISEAENYKTSIEYQKADSDERRKAIKRYERLLKRLIPIRNFLLDGLSEDYLTREKERIEKRFDLLNQSFPLWMESSGIRDYNSAKSAYKKLNDYATMERHLQNINYILSN